MEQLRKPYQGVWNIIRFNSHFYLLSLTLLSLLLITNQYVDGVLGIIITIFTFLLLFTVIISLAASYYIYDISDLYKLNWLRMSKKYNTIVNINAGFDETSALLQNKFPDSQLLVFDFYDDVIHTERSIKKARKIYKPFPETQKIKTTQIPVQSESVDLVCVILAAHEIRNESERLLFFKELNRIVKKNGEVVVTEHLRDLANFVVYNVGSFHFYSKKIWIKTFRLAAFHIKKEEKITPFISTFILQKNGITS